MLKAKNDHKLLPTQKKEEFPAVDNYNTDKTAPTKKKERESPGSSVIYGHLAGITDKHDSIVDSTLVKGSPHKKKKKKKKKEEAIIQIKIKGDL